MAFSKTSPWLVAARAVALALGLGQVASGQTTWVVDDDGGPGVHFTDLPPAVAAAGPWDVIDLRAGTYNGALLTHGLRILGEGSVATLITGPLVIRGVPASQVVCLAGFRCGSLTIEDTDALVVLEDLVSSGLVALRAADVRLLRAVVWGGIEMEDSRVELVDGAVLGETGATPGGDGGHGIVATRSELLIGASEVVGGGGGDDYWYSLGQILDPGDGGDGLRLVDTAAILVGIDSTDVVRAGVGGIGDYPGGHWVSGATGRGIVAGVTAGGSASLRISDVTVTGQPPMVVSPGVSQQLATEDPVLLLDRPVSPGAIVTLTVHGAPNEQVRLDFGRNAIRVPDAGSPVGQLTSAERRAFLGAIPPSGSLAAPLHVPVGWPRGTLFLLQARVVDPVSGAVRRSNSAPFLVR